MKIYIAVQKIPIESHNRKLYKLSEFGYTSEKLLLDSMFKGDAEWEIHEIEMSESLVRTITKPRAWQS